VVGGAGVAVVAGRAIGFVRVRTHTGGAHVSAAVVAVAGARGPVGLVVHLAVPQAVARVGIVAVPVAGAAAAEAGRLVRMGTNPGRAHLLRAVDAVARARGPVGLVVHLAVPQAVARVGIVAVAVAGAAAAGAGRLVRMGADPRRAHVLRA